MLGFIVLHLLILLSVFCKQSILLALVITMVLVSVVYEMFLVDILYEVQSETNACIKEKMCTFGHETCTYTHAGQMNYVRTPVIIQCKYRRRILNNCPAS